ncbi:MAG: DUF3667 domain-containing protein [Xanthomonadaceae bacterium]|nr:DUF3667 domain-containing protein [Xanthomonadaceae bacterium]
MSAHDAPSALARCDNCGTVLQGGFCHVCGQHAHNPLRSFAHAAEEVFESFWHLDGRIFRTLADLFVPGRVAVNYLSGQRVRYLPPLRVFIILSVLTFFVGKLTLHVDATGETPNAAIQRDNVNFNLADGGKSELMTQARTVEEVLRLREEALQNIAKARREFDAGWFGEWFGDTIGDFAAEQVDERARERMRALGAAPAQWTALDAAAGGRRGSGSSTDAQASTASAAKTPVSEERSWLSGWLRERLIRLKRNVDAVNKNPDEFVRLVLGAVPSALFVLVPVFALCLKLLYLRSGRGYLEHLVVALYSHAMMLLALLMCFVLVGLQSLAATPAWLDNALAIAAGLGLTLAMPLYLLWMQKRVYAQGWPTTLTKFALLGSLYSVLLIFATIYAVLAGLSS